MRPKHLQWPRQDEAAVLTVPDTIPAPIAPRHVGPLTPRYDALGLIGAGGLGQVLRARDHRLGVQVALKVLHAHLVMDPDWTRRFDDEARLLATLTHPGIPPVHDLDALPDGRPFYAMALIEGERWADLARGLGLRRRIELVRDIAQTVGWAHQQGVVHRDLSPNNVLVERDGRARVIDWGLARRLGQDHVPVTLSERAGTPGFAAPELGAGAATPQSDVYALGGLLAHGLAQAGPDEARFADPDLQSLWISCRELRPDARPADGLAVSHALQAWLDGDTRRARALHAVGEAKASLILEEEAQRRAELARRDAARASERHEVWAAEDRAIEAEIDAARRSTEAEQALHIALHEDDGCEPAHAALTALWHDRLLRADEARDRVAVARLETQLRGWRGGRYAALADSDGVLRVMTEPPADQVTIQRYEARGRRLVPVDLQVDHAPAVEARLPAGSYRLRIERRSSVTLLPFRMPRGGEFTFRGPDGEPAPIPLAPDPLGVDDCYVPGGWYQSVPDPGAAEHLDADPTWLAPYIISRHPVTVGEWLEYLDALAEERGVEAALERSPREIVAGSQPRRLARRVEGRFQIDGDEWFPTWPRDWPVTLVDHADASAYAAWRASRGGLAWRLPSELEWELAARGADGRIYAWGDHMEPGWACNALVSGGAPRRAAVTEFPLDESPFGVRGVTGNVRDWCAEAWTPPAGRPPSPHALTVVRGGSWSSAPPMCRLAMRFAGRPTDRLTVLGLRLAASVTGS